MAGLDLSKFVEAAQDDLTRTLGASVRAHRSEPAVDLADGSVIFPHAIAQGLVELVAPLIAASALREAGDVLVEQKPGLPVMHDVRTWLHENADRIEGGDS